MRDMCAFERFLNYFFPASEWFSKGLVMITFIVFIFCEFCEYTDSHNLKKCENVIKSPVTYLVLGHISCQ